MTPYTLFVGVIQLIIKPNKYQNYNVDNKIYNAQGRPTSHADNVQFRAGSSHG